MKHLRAIDFSGFDKVEDAASAAYLAICADCTDTGQSFADEVQLYSPEQSAERGYTSGWHLVWECGPENWGVSESMHIVLSGILPPWGFCETHWGFDLIFVEEEM